MFNAHKPVFEEINLSTAFEKDEKKRYQKIIKKFNKERVWGWKRPSSINYLDKVEAEVRNPFYVVVIRDVFSVGARNELSMGHDVISSMQDALSQQQLLLDFLSNTKSPVLLASVEKIKQYPKSFIDNLVEFTGLTPEFEEIENAVGFIEPEPMEYIEASRINRSHGQIGGCKNGRLFGWGCWMYRPEPVEVELFINGEFKASIKAEDWREHGKDIPSRRNGYCGYQFDLNNLGVKLGDSVSIRVKGEIRDLKNSPLKIAEEHLTG